MHPTPDPDDKILLECADAARADYLVTREYEAFSEVLEETKVITSREIISIVALHPVP